jgi:hypothetical protein
LVIAIAKVYTTSDIKNAHKYKTGILIAGRLTSQVFTRNMFACLWDTEIRIEAKSSGISLA